MQRNGNMGPFAATLSQATGLTAVMAFGAEFSDMLTLELDSTGMRAHAVNTAQSAFLDAHFEARGSDTVFKNWRLEPSFLALHLNPKLLAKLLRSSMGSASLLSTLQLSVGAGREDRLTLLFSNLSKHGVAQRSQYEVAMLEPVGEYMHVAVDGNGFAFTAQLLCTLPCILADVVAQLKAAGCREVRLALAPGSVSFASVGADLQINCEITLQENPDGGKLCLVVDGAVTQQATFNFKFFEHIAGLCKVSSQVVLQLGEDAPLSVVCQLIGGGFARLYLAPVVDPVEP